MKLIPCKEEEATHVRILEEYEDTLIYGAIYKRHFDSNPSEQTHYVICEDGSLYYDFECVVKVEYLKLSTGLRKPKIKNNKFNNMTDEIWEGTNAQSKENRGISNITLDDLEGLPVAERSTSEIFMSIREKIQAAIKKKGLTDSEVREMLDRPEEDD